MCDCMHNDAIWCLLARLKSQGVKEDYSFSECLGGCACLCHSAPIDEQTEVKKVLQQETQQVMVKFADMPHMQQCPSCKMRFVKPDGQWGRGER